MRFKHVEAQKLSFYKTTCFPKRFTYHTNVRNIATIGMGGNIGDMKRRFEKVVHFLRGSKQVDVVRTSIILKNPPFGFLEQDFFYNTIIEIQTKNIRRINEMQKKLDRDIREAQKKAEQYERDLKEHQRMRNLAIENIGFGYLMIMMQLRII